MSPPRTLEKRLPAVDRFAQLEKIKLTLNLKLKLAGYNPRETDKTKGGNAH